MLKEHSTSIMRNLILLGTDYMFLWPNITFLLILLYAHKLTEQYESFAANTCCAVKIQSSRAIYRERQTVDIVLRDPRDWYSSQVNFSSSAEVYRSRKGVGNPAAVNFFPQKTKNPSAALEP